MAGHVLGIDCATEACSVALYEGAELVSGTYEVIGRGHAERLVPMIAELPGRGHANRILVSLGPGSFTGVRIGLAVGRALGLAWGAEVRGYPTLALVAGQAIAEREGPVTVCMNGGHGEWFVQNFDACGVAEDEVRSLPPEAAREARRHRRIAGSRATDLAAIGGDDCEALNVLPDARSLGSLAEAHLTADLGPIYGRPPDAILPGERR
ncbi:tRNA (adenosine(37)-N6)-threonylcarbamoyltransferase complex dimerization subunit type 1 TsaB [Croceibacterium salegens]|uniref:tRNA (adenosine(37)-N6)-threonylcarbamoyltransferase complex dimerization subunit type 1 TsaB n=1 Tax=Croceibacterium salegens TaxID=1737568 RepID=UPI000B054A4E|nr:tRNA (adenosine(37)-N6)-threonylcarbamoyltransferase complex dimerization subunit type 1 TsaB [Croceibacterium salegens]